MTEMTAPEIIDLVREYGAYCVIIDDARTDAAVRHCLKSEADEVLTRISAAILLITSDYEADADTKS